MNGVNTVGPQDPSLLSPTNPGNITFQSRKIRLREPVLEVQLHFRPFSPVVLPQWRAALASPRPRSSRPGLSTPPHAVATRRSAGFSSTPLHLSNPAVVWPCPTAPTPLRTTSLVYMATADLHLSIIGDRYLSVSVLGYMFNTINTTLTQLSPYVTDDPIFHYNPSS